MTHLIEPAASGRARCRGCGTTIGAGELRFGERVPNPFAEGETTHWFHLECAAFKRPVSFLETIAAGTELTRDLAGLESEARRGIDHRRLPRVDRAERSPSGRARCRSCREAIVKGDWRIALVFYEDGRFEPSGFIHARCSRAYLETTDLLSRVRRFSPDLTEENLAELQEELARPPDQTPRPTPETGTPSPD